MQRLLLVAAGGAIGAVLRFLIATALQRLTVRWLGFALPLGTLVVNLSGCLLIGLLMALVVGPARLPEAVRLLLVVGVLGGYTTFSSFSYETIELAEQRSVAIALLYVVTTNIACVAGAWIGWRIGEWLQAA